MSYYPPLAIQDINTLVDTALAEDIGRGDITSNLIIAEGTEAEFVIAVRSAAVICGLPMVERIFAQLDPSIKLQFHYKDGDEVASGNVVVSGQGSARSVLMAERTALNLLQHLSGIATLTKQYVEAVVNTGATILDTRKTLPGLRALQKYAVTMGGGRNHRLRLDDGILIKDNHISVCGGIKQAVEKARLGAPLLTAIEVECDTLEQVREATDVKADIIMLDNMDTAMLRQAVALVGGRIPLEASGNVTLATVRKIAETGVDFISVGKLTHSVQACDIGLDIVIKGTSKK